MKYPKYTPSRIKWNHAYPAHWICEKAKRFFMNPKKLNKENKESNILSLTLNGVIQNNSSKPIGLSPSDYATYQIFNANELVFKLIDLNNISTSRVGIVTERGIMSSAYIRFVPRSFMNIRYFYYQYFDWYKRHIFNGLGEGVRQTLSGNDLRNIEILVPPLEEQDQISRYLDWKTSKINKFIKAKKKLITLLKEQKQNIINEAVTKGINPGVKMKDSGVAWLGEIPEYWNVIRLKNCLSSIEQGWSPQCESQSAKVNEWGVLKVGCVNSEHFNPKQNKKLPDELKPKLQYIIQKNDIIVSRANTVDFVGLAAIVDKNYPNILLCDKLYRLKVKTGVAVENFLIYSIRCSASREQIEEKATGASSSMQNISQSVIRNLLIAFPPVDEQKSIVKYIKKETALIDRTISRTEREIELIQEYRTRLVSDVVTGKVDVRFVEIPDFDSVEMEQEVEGDEEAEDELITESIEE